MNELTKNKKIVEKDSFLSDCCQTIIKEYHTSSNKDIIQANYSCPKCGKYIKIYPNQEKAKEMDEQEKEEALVRYWKDELSKRGYYIIKDTEYIHHGEIILRELQDDLSSLEMKILGEVKGDQAIIYLQPESCCSLADEYKREPIKLPLIQLPANTKNIKYFDYFPSCWKHPVPGFDENWEGSLKDIWEDRNKSTHLGTYFPKAKTELMDELVNKGFQWKGGEEKDNFIEAVCPRCGWIYNCRLTEKYLKVEEQRKVTKAVKSHEC